MPVEKSTDALDWEDLRHFRTLAERGTLSAAARGLGVTHGTVARRLAALERRLGCALFLHGRDGYRLTPRGRLVLAQANAMQEAARAVLLAAEDTEPVSGTVRLTTARTMADGFLVPRLVPLRAAHPALDLVVTTESRVASLARFEADVALRLGRPEGGELVGRRVATIAYRFHAAPGFAGAMEDALIGFEEGDPAAEAAWLARHLPGARYVLRTNSQTAQAAAARAGLGVALLPGYLARGDAGLREVAATDHPPDREVWLLTRRERAAVPRIRAVVDALAAIFATEWPA
jgi:DNA-binding transcriptional LysR family regulator